MKKNKTNGCGTTEDRLCNKRDIRRTRSDSKSGLQGAMSDGKGKWISRISIGGETVYLGHFNTAEEAHAEYLLKLYEHSSPKRWVNKDRNYSGYVYVIRWQEYYKIGKAKDPRSRVDAFQSFMPTPIEVVCLIPSDEPFHLERKFHEKFLSKRVGGEWFVLAQEDVEYIEQVRKTLHENPRSLI